MAKNLLKQDDNHTVNNNQNHNQNHVHNHGQPRTLRDHMNPIRIGSPSCLFFPPDASHFNFKSNTIQIYLIFMA